MTFSNSTSVTSRLSTLYDSLCKFVSGRNFILRSAAVCVPFAGAVQLSAGVVVLNRQLGIVLRSNILKEANSHIGVDLIILELNLAIQIFNKLKRDGLVLIIAAVTQVECIAVRLDVDLLVGILASCFNVEAARSSNFVVQERNAACGVFCLVPDRKSIVCVVFACITLKFKGVALISDVLCGGITRLGLIECTVLNNQRRFAASIEQQTVGRNDAVHRESCISR